LLEKDETSKFKLIRPAQKGSPTPLILSMVSDDINNDKKMDIITGQGEEIEERIFISKNIQVGNTKPVISHFKTYKYKENARLIVKARIHDNKSPNTPQD
jgi:hypothetical protein